MDSIKSTATIEPLAAAAEAFGIVYGDGRIACCDKPSCIRYGIVLRVLNKKTSGFISSRSNSQSMICLTAHCEIIESLHGEVRICPVDSTRRYCDLHSRVRFGQRPLTSK